MAKYLVIAGHGKRKNGTFDSGATGVITKGEHRYVKENLFPEMKKYADKDFHFFDSYNVYSHGNLVALANKYGKQVIEIHYDQLTGGTGNKARGGHVIIHKDYKPDAMDKRLVNAIGSMVGKRFTFRGIKGLSGRNDLGNLNIARKNGINYRLIELGFGDNKQDADIMLNKTNEYAKKLVEAIKGGKSSGGKPTESKPSKPSKPSGGKKSAEQVAQDIVAGKGGWGNDPSRKKKLTDAGYNASSVQKRVNEILGGKSSKPKKKSEAAVAKDIANGKGGWGNNPERARKLKAAGYNASSVQKRVNDILGGKKSSSGGQSRTSIVNQIKKGIDNKGRRIPTGRAARAKHFGVSRAEMNIIQDRVNKELR